MGYYVKLEKSTMFLPEKFYADALKIWNDLNLPENDHLKRGGGRHAAVYTAEGRDTSTYRYAKWYSWMPHDYHLHPYTAREILELLGFTVRPVPGGLLITDYDSKTGQEELFISRAAHLMTGSMYWRGEDGLRWAWHCAGQDVIEHICDRVFLIEKSETT